ncbi:MAG: TetR/AcrR family transcriptional regulator [Lachnospiraceae bacterium]|nr:TetR/AcrR family transcriptional regulator [Lachnospiraceae bacterium]
MIHTTFERLPKEKRNRILQAARAEFLRYPYEKTSINRILAEAEVPKGSFYQYFDDKADLFSLCTCAVYKKLIDARKKNGEALLDSGMLRMKKLGYEKGYQAFSKDLERYLSEEDFKLFENMMEAPRHIRNFVQMNAASTLIAPVLKEELIKDKSVRKDIDYDYYAYLLSLTEVISVDYGTRTGLKMEDFFFLGFQYMWSVYDSICPRTN